MARPISTKTTKTELTIEPGQIPINAVLEMVQRMAGVPPPYEPRNRGTKAARAANRKKKTLNLPATPTPTPEAPTMTSSFSSTKPTRTITSASIHLDKHSNPDNPAVSFEFTFGDATKPGASVPGKGRRNRSGKAVTMKATAEVIGDDLREFIDPIMMATNGNGSGTKPKPKIEQRDEASYEREAEKIWARIKDPLCLCRKQRVLEKLQKHKENLQHVNDLLKARVMAYQAFGDQLTAELDNRNLGIVLVVTETLDGKADMKFQIEKKPEEVVG